MEAVAAELGRAVEATSGLLKAAGATIPSGVSSSGLPVRSSALRQPSVISTAPGFSIASSLSGPVVTLLVWFRCGGPRDGTPSC